MAKPLTIMQKAEFIRQHPCFNKLTINELKILARVSKEIIYPADHTIVQEGDAVDSIYLVLEGFLEVAKEQEGKRQAELIPIARINAGEAIGLSSSGIYSTTGLRTASVTSLTNVHVLRLKLADLEKIMQKYPAIKAQFEQSAEIVFRLEFIKQAIPFATTNANALIKLAQEIKETRVKKGTLLFKENEQGDRCDLIKSGRVEVFSHDEKGKKHTITFLSENTIIGEATLIYDTPRNASIKAITDCQLLILDRTQLRSLLHKEKSVYRKLSSLTIQRSRPVRTKSIEYFKRESSNAELTYLIKNKENNNYYALNNMAWEVWQLLDGQLTTREVIKIMLEEHEIYNYYSILTLLIDLCDNGFIELKGFRTKQEMSRYSPLKRFGYKIYESIHFYYRFDNADSPISTLYKKGVHLIFTWSIQILFFFLALLGGILFILHTPVAVNALSQSSYALLWLIPGFLIMDFITVPLHELGHAFATKHFGHKINSMGFGWFLLPMAHCDAAEIWLAKRWKRIIVDIAGVYSDIIIAALLSFLALAFSGYALIFCWGYALYLYLRALFNLSPLTELDGYCLCADLFDNSDIRKHAIKWLAKILPRSWKNLRHYRAYQSEVLYWVICIVFIALIALVAFLLQRFIFDPLIANLHPYLHLSLPITVIILSIYTNLIRR